MRSPDAHHIKALLHGSFKPENYPHICEAALELQRVGVEIVGPRISKILGETDGFVHLEGDSSQDPVTTELEYLSKRRLLQPRGFSYYINPQGKLGTSAAYELGQDQVHGVRTLFSNPLQDLPAFVPGNSVWTPRALAEYIETYGMVPPPIITQEMIATHLAVQEVIRTPEPFFAVGAIVEDHSNPRSSEEKNILLVKTYKWRDKWSLPGGRMKTGERISSCLERQVQEQTGLAGKMDHHVTTFDGMCDEYHIQNTQRVFADYVFGVTSTQVELDDRAHDYLWIPASNIDEELGDDVEANAKYAIKQYLEIKP